MRVRVYMKDGRTCYRLAGVEELNTLIRADPTSAPALDAERAYWNAGQALWHFEPIRVVSLDRESISVVEEDAP